MPWFCRSNPGYNIMAGVSKSKTFSKVDIMKNQSDQSGYEMNIDEHGLPCDIARKPRVSPFLAGFWQINSWAKMIRCAAQAEMNGSFPNTCINSWSTQRRGFFIQHTHNVTKSHIYIYIIYIYINTCSDFY